MLKIENTEVIGWEAAIRGMRNPKNSWEKSDSFCKPSTENCCGCHNYNKCAYIFELTGKPYQGTVGPKDLDLMTRLRNAGTDHRKFMRMIAVYLDITAPRCIRLRIRSLRWMILAMNILDTAAVQKMSSIIL